MGKSESSTNLNRDRVAIGVPPPLVIATLVLSGRGLQFAFPTRIFETWWVALAIGLPFLVVALGLQVTSLFTLVRAKTTPLFRSTSLIVRHGPFRRSRNPIYLGFLIWSVGLPLVVNTVWLLPFFPLLLIYFRFWVIPREEDYLGRKFAEDYGDYRSKVARWL